MNPAGARQHLVEIQQKSTERDASGGEVEVWHTVVKRWVEFVPMTGKEIFEAHQVDGRQPHLLRMLPYKALTPSHRMLYGFRPGVERLDLATPLDQQRRVLHITAIQNVQERNILMEVRCMEDV